MLDDLFVLLHDIFYDETVLLDRKGNRRQSYKEQPCLFSKTQVLVVLVEFSQAYRFFFCKNFEF